MEHRPHARHREIRLDVLLMVPAQGADAIPGADTERLQGGGEPLRSLSDHGIWRMAGSLAFERDHLAVRKHVRTTPEERSDAQWHVLHRRVHECSSLIARWQAHCHAHSAASATLEGMAATTRGG